jgi:hypothetical protein
MNFKGPPIIEAALSVFKLNKIRQASASKLLLIAAESNTLLMQQTTRRFVASTIFTQRRKGCKDAKNKSEWTLRLCTLCVFA